MTDAEVHAQGLEALEQLQADFDPDKVLSFSWSGGDYPCLTGSGKVARSLAIDGGGYVTDADLVIFVRNELFGGGETPAPQQVLEHQDTDYKVAAVIRPQNTPFLKLICVDSSKGLG